MKLVLATTRNPGFPTITEYLERAVRRLGHEVTTFDDRAFLLPGRLRDAVPALQRLELARLNRGLVRCVRTRRADLLLCAGGERILPTTVAAARRAGVTTALWTIDPVKPADPRIPLASAFDFVFCGGTEMLVALEGTRLQRPPRWLPFGCDAELHRPLVLGLDDRRRYAHDIAFVGSLHPALYGDRLAMLEALADLDLGVWGPGAFALPAKSPVRARVCGGEVSYEVWRRIYAGAAIVLCAHYSGPGPRSLQASPRVYEVLACGTFLLCDDRPDVRALFQDGVDLAIFRDTRELREKAEYYLAHPNARQAVARRGQDRVLTGHTYRHRLATLLRAVRDGA
ncbi:MAG: glycosyltransferase [Candidatus Methylomirabilales bacterium]